MANYKSVNNPNGYTFNLEIEKLTDKMTSPVTQSNLKFTYADRTNNSREEVNIFSSFRLPVNSSSITDFVTAFNNTAPSYLNQDIIIFAPIPKDEYGEMVDGKTIKFEFPTTGGTVDIYGTYSSVVQSNGDALYSDADERLAGGTYALGSLTHDPVSNAAVNPPNVNEYYKSNVCLLFSDTIATPIAGGSWATGWGTNNPYAVGGKIYYESVSGTTTTDDDQPVGIAYLDSGFIVITDPTLTHDIDVAGMFNADGTPYVGGTTDFADIYYSATTANAYFDSINSEYVLNVLCIAEATEFNTSTNPTYIAPSDVRISEVALYGDSGSGTPGELLAYGKLDRPIEKGSGDYISFVVQIKA